MTDILIVEDDENLRLGLLDNLEAEGFSVSAAATLKEAEALLQERKRDLVVLDLMLPDGDGYTLCRRIREEGRARAVLMLTARTLEDDLVRGFEAGADDYLAKPYRLRELLARVRALLRRAAANGEETARFGGFLLDRSSRSLTDSAGARVELTKTEFDLLACLLGQRGRVLSRDQILDSVWGPGIHVDHRTVDNFVLSLRRKLRWEPQSPFRIETVRGVGYRMVVDE